MPGIVTDHSLKTGVLKRLHERADINEAEIDLAGTDFIAILIMLFLCSILILGLCGLTLDFEI